MVFSPLILSVIICGIGGFPINNASKSQLTFMSYNIHFSQGEDDLLNLERIAQNILIYDPDIIGLQEVEVGRVTSQGVDMTHWLAKRLNMYSYYYNPPGNKHVMGNAILSKYPITSASGYEIPSTLQERVLIHCVVEISSALKLDIFNTHLGIRSENKFIQVNYVLNIIDKVSTSSQQILMGDLNLRRSSSEIAPVFVYFSDTAEIVPDDQQAKIDYIFVRGHKRIVDYRVITNMIPYIDTPAEYGSDHLPVHAIVSW